MQIRIESEWTVGQLIEFEREQVLRVNHEYQRGLRWTETQKRMLLTPYLEAIQFQPSIFIRNKHQQHPFKTLTLTL